MKVVRNKPINLLEQDLSLFEHELEKVITPIKPTVYKNVYLNSSGCLFSKSLKVYKETTRHNFSLFEEKKFVLGQLFKKKIISNPSKKTPIVLFDEWTGGYFHWFGDLLPKLLFYKDLIKNSTILLPSKYDTSFYKKSLSYFNDLNIIYFQDNELIYSNNIMYLGNIAPTGNYNELMMKQLRSIFLPKVEMRIEKTPQRNIYISRKNAIRRKVVNEDELIPILEKYNFEIYCFEDLNFEEQVKIISETKNLISIHGAGLMNMLFMKQHNNVLEFKLRNDFSNLCYFSLASALDINYYYQLADSQHRDEDTFSGNFIINAYNLEKNIKQMLNQSKSEN